MVDEVITKQELIDAGKDAQSLDDFIHGGDEQIVITRLLKEYPTLANVIRQIYEKGGKFYQTLAEANADIANIRTDVYVITGDNGAYYKATAEATTLTKSAYDPLTQAKGYADGKHSIAMNFLYSKTGVEAIKQSKALNDSLSLNLVSSELSKLNILETDNYINQFQFNKAGEKLNISVNTPENSVIDIKKLTAGYNIRNLNFKVIDSANTHEINLIETENILNNMLYSSFIDAQYKVSNIDEIIVNNNTTYETILFRVPAFFDTSTLSTIDNRLIYDRLGKFGALTNGIIETTRTLAVEYNRSTSLVTFSIPYAEILADGYIIERQSIIDYFAKTYNNYVFSIKTANVVTKALPQILLKGSVQIITNALCNFNAWINIKKTTLSTNSYTRYESVVKNRLNVAVNNRPVFIKVKFKEGEVFSDKYIKVLDQNGTEYDCQWIEDGDFNARRNKNYGYHADGSLHCGRIVIFDNFGAKESKKYVIQVFKSKVKDYAIQRVSYPNSSDSVNITTERGDIVNLVKTTGYLINSIVTNNATYVGIEQNLLIRNNSGSPQYFGAGYEDASFRVLSEGLLFTEIESVSYNAISKTYAEINQKFLKFTTRTCIYKNGLITVKKHVQCVLDVPKNTIYGVVSRIQLNSTAVKTQRSGYNVIVADAALSFSGVYTIGDIARDPIENQFIGSKSPIFENFTGSTYIRYDMGWRTVTLAAEKPADVKDWAWTHAFEINLNETQTDNTVLSDIVLNPLVGFASSKSSYSPVRKSEIMSHLGDVISGLADWYQYQATTDDKGGGIINALAAKIVKHLHKGVSSFDKLYTEFSDWATTYYGGVSSINLGSASEHKSLQYVSRNVSPVLYGLYKLALKHDDQVRVTALKGVVSRLSSQAYSGLIEVATPINSNFYAAGFRLWAMAVEMGLDTTGKYASALTMLDGKYSSRSNFATTQNIITDNELENIITSRYLHYQVYAANNYLIGCNIANRQPTFDLSSYVLDSIHSYGGISEIDFCIAETRRNGPSTVAFIFHILMQDYDTSKLEAASRLLNAFNEYLGNVRGNQYKMWDAYSHINISTSFSDVLFTANIFADTFIIEHFSQ